MASAICLNQNVKHQGYRVLVGLAQAQHKKYKAIKPISGQDHKLIIHNKKPVVYVGKLLYQHAAIYHPRQSQRTIKIIIMHQRSEGITADLA